MTSSTVIRSNTPISQQTIAMTLVAGLSTVAIGKFYSAALNRTLALIPISYLNTALELSDWKSTFALAALPVVVACSTHKIAARELNQNRVAGATILQKKFTIYLFDTCFFLGFSSALSAMTNFAVLDAIRISIIGAACLFAVSNSLNILLHVTDHANQNSPAENQELKAVIAKLETKIKELDSHKDEVDGLKRGLIETAEYVRNMPAIIGHEVDEKLERAERMSRLSKPGSNKKPDPDDEKVGA